MLSWAPQHILARDTIEQGLLDGLLPRKTWEQLAVQMTCMGAVRTKVACAVRQLLSTGLTGALLVADTLQ